MSSINEAVNFIFANEYSEKYGVALASAFGSTSRSTNVESRSLIITKNIFSNIFDFHKVTYDNPLEFDLIIYNTDGTWINAEKERQLKKWLLKNKRQWLQIEQSDLSDIEYYVIATSAELLDVGTYSGGMKISFQADAPWAWSGLKKKTYSSTASSTFSLNNVVDFDQYTVYPQLIITSNANQSLSIKNNTTNETITITGCTTGEVISIDCRNDKISSSLGGVMIDRWSGKQTIGFIEGVNSVTLTGSFSLLMQYRTPIRIGA